MVVVIDTDAVSPRERFDYWAAASCDAYHPLELRRDGDGPFRGRARGHALGPLSVYRIEADASSVHRTPRAIAVSDPEMLVLGVVARGRCNVTQGDHASVIHDSDITGYDSSRPYSVHAVTPFDFVAFMIPLALLRPHVDRIRATTGARIGGDEGLGRLAAPFFLDVATGVEKGRLREDDVDVAEAVLDLVRGLYAGQAGTSATRSGAELRARIRAFIDRNLADPELSPQQIAKANAVSIRYLHKLFESEGATVGEWIRDRRLEHSRRDLADARLRDETITAIASRWGLTNAAHFSRAFREAYGCSPREYRRSARPD